MVSFEPFMLSFEASSRYRYKYPQFVTGERTGGKVRKKLKLPPDAPEAPDAPEPPVKHHHSRKAEKKQK